MKHRGEQEIEVLKSSIVDAVCQFLFNDTDACTNLDDDSSVVTMSTLSPFFSASPSQSPTFLDAPSDPRGSMDCGSAMVRQIRSMPSWIQKRLLDVISRCVYSIQLDRLLPSVQRIQIRLRLLGVGEEVVQALLPICASDLTRYKILGIGDAETYVFLVGDHAELQEAMAPPGLALPKECLHQMRSHETISTEMNSGTTIALTQLLEHKKSGPAAPQNSAPETKHECDSSVTTLMVRNLPSWVTQTFFLDLLNTNGFAGLFDFCYVPVTCFRTKTCCGHAFVNLTAPELVSCFISMWHGSRHLSPGQAPLNVSIAAVQGLEQNIQRWQVSGKHIRNPALKPYILK